MHRTVESEIRRTGVRCSHVKRIVLGILAWSTVAHADAPRLTLQPGALFVQLDLELNVAKDAVAKPFSIAPDVSSA